MPDKTPLTEMSDEDLFLEMAVYNNDAEQSLAKRAFAELHRRYAVSLYERCKSICKRLGYPSHTAEDLVSLVLTKTFNKADQYNPAKGNANVEPRKRTLAWLCQIAENMLRDHKRNPNRPNNPLEPKELQLEAGIYSQEDFARFYNEQVQTLPTRQHYLWVGEAFETLDGRTQRVLLETFIQRSKSISGTAMQRGSAKMLADHLDTTTDNIRLIRKKGLTAINQYLEIAMLSQRDKHEKESH